MRKSLPQEEGAPYNACPSTGQGLCSSVTQAENSLNPSSSLYGQLGWLLLSVWTLTNNDQNWHMIPRYIYTG